MLITESFNTQLDDLLERVCINLQISPSQHNLAEERYVAVGKWLSDPGSPLSHLKLGIYPQGSFMIGTTAKPLGQQEYDLDLVCEIQVDWTKIPNPLLLLNAVEERLRAHDVYKLMVQRKNRCIRLRYANEFHLDILPACPDMINGGTCVRVPDREAKEWKPSNPKGYAEWFESKCRFFKLAMVERMEPLPDYETGQQKAPLKRAVQLLKRWRDIVFQNQEKLAPISIVLTTLAGQHYMEQELVNDALTCVLDRIVASLSPRGKRLVVLNPSNPEEDLSERWDETPEAYQAFVGRVTEFQKQWHELNKKQDIPKISQTLEILFGEKLVKEAVLQQARAIEKARQERRLGVSKATGILSSLSSSRVMPVRPNTFYGE